jgi:periplasmic protein TonB
MSGQSHRSVGPVRKPDSVSATWDQAVASYLVGCAARKAPPGLAERLEEEWRADLVFRRGAFCRIRFGLGCCWATRVIAREFGAAAATAGTSASGQQLLVAHGGYDFSRFSRRTTAMIAIICLHAAVFYAYMSGLTQGGGFKPAQWMHGIDIVPQPRRPDQPAPLPPPTITHTIVEIPTPDQLFKLPAGPTAITVAHSPKPNVAPLPPPIPKPVERVMGGPGVGFPDTEDYYPAVARRLGEAGAAAVRVCVDPRGSLTAAPAIVESSGIREIDEGALRLARAGSGHYRPTTEDGQPVSACYAFRIRFQLGEQ